MAARAASGLSADCWQPMTSASAIAWGRLKRVIVRPVSESHHALAEDGVVALALLAVGDLVGDFDGRAGVDPVVDAERVALVGAAVGRGLADVQAVVAEDQLRVLEDLALDLRRAVGELYVPGVAVVVEA